MAVLYACLVPYFFSFTRTQSKNTEILDTKSITTTTEKNIAANTVDRPKHTNSPGKRPMYPSDKIKVTPATIANRIPTIKLLQPISSSLLWSTDSTTKKNTANIETQAGIAKTSHQRDNVCQGRCLPIYPADERFIEGTEPKNDQTPQNKTTAKTSKDVMRFQMR